MRPVPSGNRPSNSQPRGRPDALICGPSATPIACFITDEASLEASQSPSPPRLRQYHDQRKWRHVSNHQSPSNVQPPPAMSSAPIPRSASSLSGEDQDPLNYHSQPGTPLFLGLSGPESALSSSSSRRSSIAGPSVDDQNDLSADDASVPRPTMSNTQDNDGSVPQLIMPSLTVPRRKPFSNVGKTLGKLKIMVAGRPGLGKTSLIWSLAQRCDHVVHMDQVDPSPATHATEFYASTKPHPWWKADSHFIMSDARRKSLTAGEMLDRNICFVESTESSSGFPGSWGNLHYVQSQLTTLIAKPMDDSDLFELLNAGGGPIVDVLLYLIPHTGLEAEDIEYIENAQRMTNVIPVLAQVDRLSGNEIDEAKRKVIQRLRDEGLVFFSFTNPQLSAKASLVYAVSTETRSDYDIMDASVLMDSEYIPPLVPTDLNKLTDRIFSLDGSSQLRHSAALKGVEWRRKHSHHAIQSASQNQSLATRRSLTMGYISQAQCWERLEFYNWANNLRQSLHAERLRRLVSEKSAYVQAVKSQLVPTARIKENRQRSEIGRGAGCRHQDPLGILEIGGQLKQKGIIILEMMTSIGLLGYIVTRLVHAEWVTDTCSVAFTGSRRMGLEVPGWGTLVFW